LPKLDYTETFETVRDLLVHEVRLDAEQRHLAEAAKEYAGMDSVVIPALLPFGSPRMTAMQQIHGTTLSERLQQNDPSVRTLAPVVAQALIAAPLFSSQQAALFHGDPHAGNLFVTTEGRLAILDWSLAARLQKGERIELLQLLLGALTLDAARMQRAVQTLARHTAEPAALAEVLNRRLHELRWGTRMGIGWMTRLLDDVATRARARLKADLLLFRKSLLALEGVLADLTHSDADTGEAFLDEAVIAALTSQLLNEWPQRFQQPLNSRSFNSHLSTGDLLSLTWSGPATFARYWAGAWRDLVVGG